MLAGRGIAACLCGEEINVKGTFLKERKEWL